ncbi:MAG: hypothetical protein Q4A60_05765 [Pasteurellaceae bacterium]|nr:hypothetical protein [Pasteurellaceae bacterium]
MKKLLIASLLGLTLTACDDSDKAVETVKDEVKTEQVAVAKEEAKPKATKAEDFIKEIAFTKNEKGTVIFNNVVEMLEEMTDYNVEDKTLKVVSEKPLSIQIFYSAFADQDKKSLISDIQDAFISTVFRIFTHTNLDEITLEIIPIDQKTDKPLNKRFNLKTKVTRAKALEILNTYSAAKTFDDLVNFDENDQYNVIGYSSSKLSIAIRADNVRENVAKALTTGKINVPMEEIIVPIGFDMNTLADNLRRINPNSFIEFRQLNDGNKAYSIKLGKVVMLEGIGKEKNNLDYLTVQFAFSNDQELILQTLAGLSVGSTITPNPDKTFSEITKMIDKATKLIAKQDKIELKKVVDGFTLEMNIYKKLGGLSYLSIKKLEIRPMKFL